MHNAYTYLYYVLTRSALRGVYTRESVVINALVSIIFHFYEIKKGALKYLILPRPQKKKKKPLSLALIHISLYFIFFSSHVKLQYSSIVNI